MTDVYQLGLNFEGDELNDAISKLETVQASTSDVITLDATELAKRANVPVPIMEELKQQMNEQLRNQLVPTQPLTDLGSVTLSKQDGCISTLDPSLDALLAGGFRTGHVHEIVGPSGGGKTQWLLSTLVSGQLPPPYGISRPSLYISTEHPLPTQRVTELIASNPILKVASPKPSLGQILTLNATDLEVQDHIVNFQLPVVLERHNIGVVVIDSIAANYRGEALRAQAEEGMRRGPMSQGKELSERTSDLIKLGTLLRELAQKHDCAIICANQVADKMDSVNTAMSMAFNDQGGPPQQGYYHKPHQQQQQRQQTQSPVPTSSPLEPGLEPRSMSQISSSPPADASVLGVSEAVMGLDHQQRWFTGWGDMRPGPDTGNRGGRGSGKVPALGLIWSNQISCRIALYKEADWASKRPQMVQSTGSGSMSAAEAAGLGGADWTPKRFRRWARLVFAPWARESDEDDPGVEYEIWSGGLRNVNNMFSNAKT